MPLPPPSSLSSLKFSIVRPFWYQLIQVVLGKRPENGCCCCLFVCLFVLSLIWNIEFVSQGQFRKSRGISFLQRSGNSVVAIRKGLC